MPSLTIVGSKKDGAEVRLGEAVSVIGRDRGVTVELGDFQVSRRHALVLKTDAGFFVKDLGSRNGILVNEKRLPTRKQQKLRNGDVLTLGRTTLVFRETEGGPVPESAHAIVEEEKGTPSPSELDAAKKVAEAKERAKPGLTRPVEAPLVELRADPPERPAPRLSAPLETTTVRPPSREPDDMSALRAIVERSERERVFYRNVTLALVAFLMLLVTLLLYYALHRQDAHGTGVRQDTPAVGQLPAAAPVAPAPPRDETPRALPTRIEPAAVALAARSGRELDAKAFLEEVGPLLLRTCGASGCHGPPNGAGELKLVPLSDENAAARDLEAVRRFVVPGHPEKSLLLVKPLRREDGGEGHAGGEVLGRASTAYEVIRQWIANASPPSVATGATGDAPVPAPRTAGPHRPKAKAAVAAPKVAVGEPFILDASGSTDDGGCALQYRWAILDRPEGSQASLKDPLAAVASLVPDRPGDYVVALVVHDGKQASEPFRIDLRASPKGEDAPVRPQGGARPLLQEPRGRTFCRAAGVDLLGRPLRADETARALGATRDELLDDLFQRDELYQDWWDQQLAHLQLVDAARPSGDAFTAIPRRLKAGELSARAAFELVALKPLEQRFPANDAYAGTLLARLLGLDLLSQDGRAQLDAAKRMADGQPETVLGKTGKTREDLVKIVLDDARFATQLVAREHARIAGAALAPHEVALAAARLERTSFFALVREWASSPAYSARLETPRPKSERAFARGLYQDVTGRLPDDAELKEARGAIRGQNPRALRAALAKVLLDGRNAQTPAAGPDPRAFVTGQFERLLARAPLARELDAYVKAVADGASPSLIMRALVTSEEYETY